MTEYSDIIEVCDTENIDLRDIDRLLLNDAELDNVTSSDYATKNVPAVRETTGDEKLIYVDENGYEKVINL